jgi:hypothetical protein
MARSGHRPASYAPAPGTSASIARTATSRVAPGSALPVIIACSTTLRAISTVTSRAQPAATLNTTMRCGIQMNGLLREENKQLKYLVIHPPVVLKNPLEAK